MRFFFFFYLPDRRSVPTCAYPAAPACRRCHFAQSLTPFALNRHRKLIAAAVHLKTAVFHAPLLSDNSVFFRGCEKTVFFFISL